MKKALEDIRKGTMTIHKAAKLYKIPKTTLLRHHTSHKTTQAIGRKPALTLEMEIEIVETCQIFSEWGYGLTKTDIVNVISEYIKATKIPNLFTNCTWC